MLTGLLAILGAIPGISSLITSLTSALFNAKVEIIRAQIGGDVEKAKTLVSAANVAQHERTIALGIIAGSRILALLVVLFALPLVIFVWKVIVVDKVIGPGSFLWWTWNGSTDPIQGQVADWANTIIWAIFGSGTAVTVSQMWFSKK